MNIIEKYFLSFMINSLKILFSILLLGTIAIGISFYGGIDTATIIILLFYCIAIFAIYRIIKSSDLNLKYKILLIILIGIIARILWLLNINTAPYSDFEVLYTAAKDLANGENTLFTGVNYIARFPHLSYMIVYMSVLIKIFGETLLSIKIGNLIFSIVSMYMVYKVSLEVFDKDSYALLTLGLSSIFAPMVTYVGVLATENIAIPFYLASTYVFILYIKGKISIRKLILSGLLLGIGNLFRMVGPVMLIAFIMYIIIFTNKNLLTKIKCILSIVIPFVLILFLGSSLLKSFEITEVNLWEGKEPAITNILKGTNIDSFGRFNEEDAAIPEKYNYDYDKVKDASKEIITERLTTTPVLRLAIFYSGKFVGQWVQGDMSGVSWSESGAKDIQFIVSENAKIIFQLLYIVIIGLSLISLFNKKRIYKDNSIINLFYLILCGYGAFYLITEMQGRYSYLISWVFLILAVSGLDNLIEYKYQKKLKNNNL